jgi:hypothetical protein
LLPLLSFLKKSKRSAIENSEEHSAKYTNSNNSGNWLYIVVSLKSRGQGQEILGSVEQRLGSVEMNAENCS